jgi:hypothetical protein
MEDDCHRRTQRMNKYFPIVYGASQYGQKFLLPQFVQSMAVPAPLFADAYERERTVCIDSRKPQTCWNIHRFVHNIEWTFPDPDDREFSDQLGGADSWVSPEYFVDMKKSGITGHAILLCSMFIGLKVDAWVCVGRANISDVPDGEDTVAGRGGRGRATPAVDVDAAGGGVEDGGGTASGRGQSKEAVDYSIPFHSDGKQKWHVWVMTRESKSHHCLYEFSEGAPEREKGSVKFWDSTCATAHL